MKKLNYTDKEFKNMKKTEMKYKSFKDRYAQQLYNDRIKKLDSKFKHKALLNDILYTALQSKIK
ncbi:MAG: hypothetical protein ACI4N3_04710 [Alphaproteobacteria bacterium]